jgi:hypothetical protein
MSNKRKPNRHTYVPPDYTVELKSSFVIPELAQEIELVDRVAAKWIEYADQMRVEIVQYKDIERGYDFLSKLVDIADIILARLDRANDSNDQPAGWRSHAKIWGHRNTLKNQIKDIKKAQKNLDFKKLFVILKRAEKTIGAVRFNLDLMMKEGLQAKSTINVEEDIDSETPVALAPPPGGQVIVGPEEVPQYVASKEEIASQVPDRPFYEVLGEWEDNYDLAEMGRTNHPIDLRKFPSLMQGNPTQVAVDVARYGPDRTIIAIGQGDHTVDVRSFTKEDTMASTGHVVRAIEDYGAAVVKIETTGGLGAALVDRLKEMGWGKKCRIVSLEVQGAPTPTGERLKAHNLRAELYLNLEERLRLGTFTLPPDEELVEELAHIRYKMLSNGRIMIEDKDQTKKRLGRSPDKADSIAILAWKTPSPRIY